MPILSGGLRQARGSSRPAVARWLENNDDSRLPQRLAGDSTIPNPRISRTNPLGHGPSSVGTSQDVNISYATTINSLPALTRAPTLSSSGSVVPGMTGSEIGHRQRMLVPDPTAGGALVADIPRHFPHVLQCPFDFINCSQEFPIEHVPLWREHTLSHFRDRGSNMTVSPPRSNKCRLCDSSFSGMDGQQSWLRLMDHVASAHHSLGHRLAHARPDFDLLRHLWQSNVISQAHYRSLCAPPHTRNAQTRSNTGVTSSLDNEDDDSLRGPVAVVHERRSRNARG